MTRPNIRWIWTLASVLLLALVASVSLPSHAWGSRRQHGVHIGKHQQHRHHRFHPSVRTDIRHRHFRHHHHHHHHHGHSRHFFGLSFYGYPFYGYPYPYYYPYYYGNYTPGDHRRFPAFRLPEFFHYPGAIGKGEERSIKP
jgi:hypothetical protein